ncbi:uncharacterized protein LOC113854397 isoform X2 [Abrus precatorius]|uniref:Uncharacterized protein LOC113854397 isoform X2 n=1 Tax=Abrus precatorius TaxID=3816 RepID=A0A8B8KD78_ABRPR|nr:uncharacterized protein LOC113854397 isoform X2 [Abrus precatorius]
MELGTSKSEFPMAYRRSHLRSHTYHTLVHILSHLSASTVQDNGSGRMGQENKEKEHNCSDFVGSDYMDPKDTVTPQEEIQEVHETNERVGDKNMDFSSNKMVLDDIELMMGIEEMSTQANGLDKELKLMDELELAVKGTQDVVCDNGLIPVNLESNEKQNGSSEVGMDFQVDDLELLHSDVKSSGNARLLQDPEKLNLLASEGFDLSSTFNVSISTEGSLPTTEVGECEKEEQCGQKVAEAMHISFDMDMNSEGLNISEEGGLLDSSILKDNLGVWNGGEKAEKIICVDNTANSSNILIENGDMEEGEISADLVMNGSSFDMSSSDALILQQMKVDEVQKPKNVTGNMVYSCKTGNGESEKGFKSNSFMVNAFQDANNSGQAEPRTSVEKGIACMEFDKTGECGSLLKSGNSKDRYEGCKGINDWLTNFTQNQVLHRGFLEENVTTDHGNSSAVKLVDASRKRKHGSGSEEEEQTEKLVDASKKKKRGPISEVKKEKKKKKYRKKRAEKNREQGVKRLKLQPVQKPKTVSYCRHYLKGKCYEGDKCQFSHDTVPLTKSKPCVHFTRHSCMKGDDCPFDHQLSKYPCTNFVSRGSCSRGDTCMFSHQVPTNQDIPTPSKVCKPELTSPLQSGNTNFSTPLNNPSSSSVQQSRFTNSGGVHSCINVEHKVTHTVQKQLTPPKGINFINVAKLSSSPRTPRQGMVTTTKENPVQIGTPADQRAFGTTQKDGAIAKKLQAVTPKGINFLSFGKGSVCSFKSPIHSDVNRQTGIKLPQLLNFGLPEQPSSSLYKDDCSKVSDRTKQNVPQTDLFSNEFLNVNQAVAKGMKLAFPGKNSIDASIRDHGLRKSVQEGKKSSDNSHTSNMISPMVLRPFVSNQYSERIISGFHKHASNSGQRALLSTLAFAAEHESDIKMKDPADASCV